MSNWPARITIATVLLPAALLLAGCAGPGYYAQAIGGHLELIRQREPVAQLLAAGANGARLDPELRQKLELAREIKAFGVSQLGLPDNGSYTQFVETGRDAVTWIVVAAPEFSLQPRRWCFLFAGCLPYRGYFEQAAAGRFAARLAADGLDVAVSPTAAYSTLGWFQDPLLDTMLRYRDERLAGVILHELAHQTLYVKGDADFNESYASFIEETGVALWLVASGRAERLPGWERERAAARDLDERVRSARGTLASIYASQQPAAAKRVRKEETLKALREGYFGLVRERWDGADYFAGWFAAELNNARLALFDSYRGGICAFAALYRAAGEDMARFQAMAADRAALDETARRAWLEQGCGVGAVGPLRPSAIYDNVAAIRMAQD
jgi:predicted aminopeptidase